MNKILIRTLRRVYREYGPRQAGPKSIAVVPIEEFAKMTKKEVDRWDFRTRHLMHEVARVVYRAYHI
jgi:hypothetical protein